MLWVRPLSRLSLLWSKPRPLPPATPGPIDATTNSNCPVDSDTPTLPESSRSMDPLSNTESPSARTIADKSHSTPLSLLLDGPAKASSSSNSNNSGSNNTENNSNNTTSVHPAEPHSANVDNGLTESSHSSGAGLHPPHIDSTLHQSGAARPAESTMAATHAPMGDQQDHSDSPVVAVPDAAPPTIERKAARQYPNSRNRVLPSYEEELQADNTVVRESNPRWLYNQSLYRLNEWYHYLMGHTNVPHSSGPLSNAIDRLTRTPFHIERVVIIGVHGWFPGRLIQRVVGEPTGTSLHFAQKMALACRHFFFDRYGISLPMDAMSIIPLQGEGKVEERVELLYDQLLDPKHDWVNAIRNADLVLVSAHSQGTPVATILVSRLIEQGILDPTKQRTGILAMAGISHGPYPQLKSSLIVQYVESDPARQLFEFNDPNSEISQAYYIAAHKVLSAGTRFIAVGSWYDQAVPLYSATLYGLNHPNIYRALYIDAADYQPDFLSHLVVFALALRNAGLHDHGLIVHLSDVLAGNIYGFGTQGHYAIYEEEKTYMVAVAWTMGHRQSWSRPAPQPPSDPTQSFGLDASTIQPSLLTLFLSYFKQKKITGEQASSTCDTSQKLLPASHESVLLDPPFEAPQKINPFHLPWIMAKLISDPNIAANAKIHSDLLSIIKLFDTWDVGNSRSLKDVKYRLEPLRSKL
ncbi:hypothetical protein BSLG_002278 [Batrachochytrium salamandrivorans]|nr:hypothetical protein BASA81_017858 [Batrachochytrium salamandrivorans]KAJ1343252.1 hypothetical protein BSLG_002278 [Batrachochytrium salamandrivorans]